jgi:hypothetical protein
MKMCLILEWVPRLSCCNPVRTVLRCPFRFLCMDWDEEECLKMRGGYTIQILNAAARTKIREDRLRLSAPDLCTRIAKRTEIDGGFFESSL